MRQLAAGVTLLTTAAGGVRGGLTATAVCSASADPPQLLACVNRDAEAHDLFLASRILAVCLLGTGQRALADRFAGRTGVSGEARFAAGRWTTLATGAPVLADAPACFDCRIVGTLAAGTHTVLLATVEATLVRAGLEPLAYLGGGYGSVRRLPGEPDPEPLQP
jgi:flavin reductase (DIM6/NTAB) family NADH-FMN oxidoreductase RutF